MKTEGVTYGVILVGAMLWCAAVVMAPVLSVSQAFGGAGRLVYEFFSHICHQMDGRSFHIAGAKLGVCSRCTSIYFGFLAGSLLYPTLRSVRHPMVPRRWVLLAAVIPMLLDVLSGMIGVHEITITTRAITGSIAGVFLPFVVIPVAIEAVREIVVSPPSLFLKHTRKG